MELEVGSHATVCQTSYSEENVGKIKKTSKVRITWNFISDGHCKHEIVLSWSKTTGKQLIQMDGQDVWFGRNKGRSVLDHHWKTADERLSLHLLATCAPKMNENFRCYDLLINGQLFASLPVSNQKDLGTPPPQPVGGSNLNSIIEILYPQGYIPPTSTQQQKGQTSNSMVVSPSSNGVSQPPMVDLLT